MYLNADVVCVCCLSSNANTVTCSLSLAPSVSTLSDDNLPLLDTDRNTDVVVNTKPSLLDMLQFCCDKFIPHDADFPQKICTNCKIDLINAYKFIRQCEKSYIKIKEQLDHIKTRDSEDKYGNISATRNTTDDKLELHSELEESEPISQCSDNESLHCMKKFHSRKKNRRKMLEKHKIINAGYYFCELCQKSFKHKKLHISNMHSERTPLQCDRCSAIFKRPYSLTLHMRQHDNKLQYTCDYPECDKAFAIPSLLKQHVTSHTGERRFVCQYCSHGARSKQQLTVHIRYHHTKERNYICTFCSKAFVSHQERYNHEKRHKNIRNFACQYCDKTFVSSGNLKAHILTHTGVKEFECRLCGTRFGRKCHRDKHEANIHNVAVQTDLSKVSSSIEESRHNDLNL